MPTMARAYARQARTPSEMVRFRTVRACRVRPVHDRLANRPARPPGLTHVSAAEPRGWHAAMMELFLFRLARPDGTVAVERQEIADSLSQAVAAAFAIAR